MYIKIDIFKNFNLEKTMSNNKCYLFKKNLFGKNI